MIKLTVSEQAITKIIEKIGNTNRYVKLLYDTDGCGCGVNGVAALAITSDLEVYDIEVETNAPFSIFIDKSSAVFFDDEMQIDYSSNTHSFQLKSKQQMFNARMSIMEQ